MTAPEHPVGEVLAQAIGLYCAGDLVQAVPLFQEVLRRDPANAIAAHQLGLIAYQAGAVPTAVTLLEAAVAADPGDPEYHNNLGVALNAQNQHARAQAAFERAIALKPDYPQAVNNLGSVHEAGGNIHVAIDCYRRALEIDPGFVEARDNFDLAVAKQVPQWHFPMMQEVARNEAYDRALQRAAPGRRVLDIGTGAGLTAMMAARAGAAHVTTCEMVPQVAARACAVIAHNGLDERITLHVNRSTELVLAERAEVLVTETFASGILSEHVLATLEHARANLLVDDPVIIPRAASARGYLVGGPVVQAEFFALDTAGFDLAPFNAVSPRKIGMHLDRVPHDVLSDDFEIFAFDLMQTRFAPERRTLDVPVTRAGRCVGVAQWLWLALDAETEFDNRPRGEAGASGWMHVLYRFATLLDVEPGMTVRLVAAHNRTAMTVALAP